MLLNLILGSTQTLNLKLPFHLAAHSLYGCWLVEDTVVYRNCSHIRTRMYNGPTFGRCITEQTCLLHWIHNQLPTELADCRCVFYAVSLIHKCNIDAPAFSWHCSWKVSFGFTWILVDFNTSFQSEPSSVETTSQLADVEKVNPLKLAHAELLLIGLTLCQVENNFAASV